MKTCPICRARTFDDAEVCYGCMHRFGGEEERRFVAAEDAGWEPDDAVARPSASWSPEREKVVAGSKPPACVRAATRSAMADNACRTGERPVSERSVSHEGKHAGPHAGQSPAGAPSEAMATGRRVEPRPSMDSKRFGGSAGRTASARHAARAAPFDRTGWIVRFELPGSASPGASSADGGYEVRRPAEGGSAEAPCSLVVSICPMLAETASEEGATASNEAATTLAGAQGSQAVLPGSAFGHRARPDGLPGSAAVEGGRL